MERQCKARHVPAAFDGATYVTLATLPETRNAADELVWFRTSVMVPVAPRYDYQTGIALRNVLLQFGDTVTVHRIEATPL